MMAGWRSSHRQMFGGTPPGRLLRRAPKNHNHNHNHHNQDQEQLEISQPLPTDSLIPTCTIPLLSHSFVHTNGQPPATAAYTSSDSCPYPYPANLVLHLDAACHDGNQYYRIAAVWLDGAEILRTNTPESDPNSTVSWTFRKNVTKYSSLFSFNASLSMMLENVVNDVFTGVFTVNLTLLVYSNPESDPNWLDWDRKPADLILPVALYASRRPRVLVSDQEGEWGEIEAGLDSEERQEGRG